MKLSFFIKNDITIPWLMEKVLFTFFFVVQTAVVFMKGRKFH